MPARTTSAIIGLGVLMLALALFSLPGAADDYLEVESTELVPDPPVLGERFEVRVTLVDETDVEQVTVFYCSPLMCYAPIEMTRQAAGYYNATSDIAIESTGEHYYYFSVKYTNGTSVSTAYVYFTPFEPPSTDLEVDHVDHVPADVDTEDEVEVFCDLASEENVTGVQLFHCQGDVFYVPIDMTRLQNGTYQATIGPFDKAEEVKYTINVTYQGGYKAWTQNYTFTPKETGDGDDGDDDGFIPAMGAAAALAVLAGLAVTRKKRRR